jgi:hypothetical protein
MSSKGLITRIPKFYRKRVTFDGTAGNGAAGGTVAIASVVGAVHIERMVCYCVTSLTSSGGTLQLGTPNAANGFIASTTASNIDAGDYWQDATPEAHVAVNILKDILVDENIQIAVTTAAVTAGVMDFVMYWHPMSLGSQLG